MEGLRSFFAGWVAALPSVAASVTTAAILFGLSLLNSTVYDALFPPKAIKYPLVCIAEPVAVPAKSDRVIEFYIVNPTNENFMADGLDALLAEKLERTAAAATASARLTLVYTGNPAGKLVLAEADTEFNGDNGMLDVLAEGNNVRIGIEGIKPHTILRARMTYTGLDNDVAVARDQKSTIPFRYEDLEAACYSRG